MDWRETLINVAVWVVGLLTFAAIGIFFSIRSENRELAEERARREPLRAHSAKVSQCEIAQTWLGLGDALEIATEIKAEDIFAPVDDVNLWHLENERYWLAAEPQGLFGSLSRGDDVVLLDSRRIEVRRGHDWRAVMEGTPPYIACRFTPDGKFTQIELVESSERQTTFDMVDPNFVFPHPLARNR